jgi:hypothetical protein
VQLVLFSLREDDFPAVLQHVLFDLRALPDKSFEQQEDILIDKLWKAMWKGNWVRIEMMIPPAQLFAMPHIRTAISIGRAALLLNSTVAISPPSDELPQRYFIHSRYHWRIRAAICRYSARIIERMP